MNAQVTGSHMGGASPPLVLDGALTQQWGSGGGGGACSLNGVGEGLAVTE